ncbi:MAG: lipase maturation factor family protein, partial [Acidobacteriaceae bacterium]
MDHTPGNYFRWLFDSDSGPRNRYAPRWIFLRALAGIYFSAFLALVFQIKGLIGPHGILPAANFLTAVQHQMPGLTRFWYAPTLFWYSSTSHAMTVVVWTG